MQIIVCEEKKGHGSCVCVFLSYCSYISRQ